MPHLFVDITSHGLGHLGQTRPVLEALRHLEPGLRLTLRSGLAESLLASRLPMPFAYIPSDSDFGMSMSGGFEIDASASLAAYQALHEALPARLAELATQLQGLKPELVLSNVGYLAIEAAARAGIPAIAMSSLNWADILAAYCKGLPQAEPIIRRIAAAYAHADSFLALTPAMAMPSLGSVQPIAPAATIAAPERARLEGLVGGEGKKLVLFMFAGGVPETPPLLTEPPADTVLLVPPQWRAGPGRVDIDTIAMPFPSIAASVDLIVAKPGYGTFVEAGLMGVPVLYVRRAGWPEEPNLIAWLQQHGAGCELTGGLASLDAATVRQTLAALPRGASGIASPTAGAASAARYIAARLRGAGHAEALPHLTVM